MITIINEIKATIKAQNSMATKSLIEMVLCVDFPIDRATARQWTNKATGMSGHPVKLDKYPTLQLLSDNNLLTRLPNLNKIENFLQEKGKYFPQG